MLYGEIGINENFKPYVWLKHSEKVGSPIFAVSFMGVEYFKKVELPGHIADINKSDQLEFLEDFIKDHYSKNKDSISPFGKIIGYYCFFAENDIVEFDTDGKFIGTLKDLFNGKYELKLKNKDISFLFKNKSEQ